MNTNFLKHLAGAAGAFACLVALPASADQPGKGWDTFRTGAGEPIAVPQPSTQVSKVGSGMPGKGWDTFRTGAGEPIVASRSGAQVALLASGAPGKGWDTFRTGAGEPIPAGAAVQ